jgi:hypothetical protein
MPERAVQADQHFLIRFSYGLLEDHKPDETLKKALKTAAIYPNGIQCGKSSCSILEISHLFNARLGMPCLELLYLWHGT